MWICTLVQLDRVDKETYVMCERIWLCAVKQLDCAFRLNYEQTKTQFIPMPPNFFKKAYHTCVCICTCTCVCIHTTHTLTHIYTHTRAHTPTCKNMQTHTHKHTTHTHTHTHTHTDSNKCTYRSRQHLSFWLRKIIVRIYYDCKLKFHCDCYQSCFVSEGPWYCGTTFNIMS